MTIREQKPAIRLWHILFLALLLRLAWMFYARPEPVADFQDYRRLAEALHDEHGYVNPYHRPTAFRLPGTPWFLATLMLVSRDIFWLRLGSILLSTSICIPLYYLGNHIGRKGTEVGVGASLMGALYPPFIFYSPVLASEPLEAVLLLTVLAIISGRSNLSLKKLIGTGFLMAGAALTRGFSLFCLPFITLAVGFFSPAGIRQRLIRMLVLILAAVIPISAWYGRNAIVIGEGVGLSSAGGMNFWMGHNPDYYGWTACWVSRCPLYKIKTESGFCREGYRLGWQYIKNDPASVLRSAVAGTRELYGLPVYGWVLSTQVSHSDNQPRYRPLAFISAAQILTVGGYLLLLLLSLASLRWWRSFQPRYRNLILVLLVLHWFFYGVCFFGDRRFGYISQVFLCLFAGMTLSRLILPGRRPDIPENPPHP